MTPGSRRPLAAAACAAALAAVSALPAGAAAQALFPVRPPDLLLGTRRDLGTREIHGAAPSAERRAPSPGFTLRPALQLGGGTLSFGAPAGAAMTVGGDVRLESASARFALVADTRLARFVDAAGSSSRSTVSALARSGSVFGLHGELLGAASALSHRGYGATRRYELRGGPAAERGPYSAALRTGAARVWTGQAWRSVTGSDLYLQRAVAATVLSVSAAYTLFRDSANARQDTSYVVAGYTFRGTQDRVAVRRRRYTDVETALRIPARRVALELALGLRRGDSATEGERWVRLRGVAPLSSQLALVGELGRQPAVPEQLVPSGRFAALAMRLTPAARRGRGAPPPIGRPSGMEGGAPVGPTLTLVAGAPGEWQVRVTGVAASRVEIMGDFTDWTPVALERTGPDAWSFPRAVAAGAHRLVLRVDGGVWQPPPGLPTGADEFAGEVGVLLIE